MIFEEWMTFTMYYLTFIIPYQTIPGQSFFVHLFRSLTRVNPLSVALRNLVVEKPLDNGWRTDLDDFYSFNPQRYKIMVQVLTKRGHLMSRSRFVLNYSPGSICIFMLKLFINWKNTIRVQSSSLHVLENSASVQTEHDDFRYWYWRIRSRI